MDNDINDILDNATLFEYDFEGLDLSLLNDDELGGA
jgi:hypothetical protein